MKTGQTESALTLAGLTKILENYQQQGQTLRDNALRMEGCQMAIKALIDHEFPVLIPEAEWIDHQEKQPGDTVG